MLARHLQAAVETALSDYPAVALLGARQVGKTTLARQIEQVEFLRPAVYLDLERPSDRRKLTDAEAYLSLDSQQLVILDEVQHLPEVFPVLRSLIDEGRRSGPSSGRFLLLGSASGELLHPSGESLAGRIAYLELAPLHTLEAGAQQQNNLWLRGGFPSSLLASSDVKSMDWRRNLISTYLERELPGYGSRLPAQTLRRLWTMLAHLQGGLLDVSQLVKGLMIDLGIDTPSQGLMAIEVKKSPSAKPRRGFYGACEDLQPAHRFVVHGGSDDEAYPVGDGVMAVSLCRLAQRLQRDAVQS